jgi:hypothetical protein
MMQLHRFRAALSATSLVVLATSCVMDRAPRGVRRTPDGPGAAVRFDLAHRPLPDLPLPIDTATWPDPTSRTGLRVNASLIAPTAIEEQARKRFDQMEGWGTFSPISVSFDVDRSDPEYAGFEGAAVDLTNVMRRHQGDDYDFADDAVYLVNLETGVPVALDLGAGNFDYTLKKLDKYWANDTRATERNLLFETYDETQNGAITRETFAPEHDTDFDGFLDVPNLDDPRACPTTDPVCDNARDPAYGSADCVEKRRSRDRCVADHLLYWYERETDTLMVRPIIPLDQMTRYAVVLTDRLLDGMGHPVKSPFDFVYHATQEAAAKRVRDVVNHGRLAAYFGDLAGTGLDHVAFLWSFTTQPTVDDMKRLRDGLYGQGPFARWASEFPATLEVQRAIGMTGDLANGATDVPGWETSADGLAAGCPNKVDNLYILTYDDIKEKMRQLMVEGFDLDPGPATEALLRGFDHIDHMLIGTFRSPFLLEGGPKSTDPNAAFRLNYETGEGEVNEDTVQFWVFVPKETAEFKQPFDVNVYGHGYTGNFVEQILYAGNMAEHGLATIGINAMGHGLNFENPTEELAARAVLGGQCAAPFFDALTLGRARDLNRDAVPDSGGDFWSSYLFHTRDGVRQSILDHIQLVRILRTFGTTNGSMACRNATTGWASPASAACDVNGDGAPDVMGDFDGDGTADFGGPNAKYGTWGESLGGILSAIHGAIDAYVTSAVPGSGGGGLTDIGVRSFQGGVIEAVLLRIWGPLIVTVPSEERPACKVDSKEDDRCTICQPGEVSLRWVVPDVNGTGEVEVTCLSPSQVQGTTVLVNNLDNGEVRCARVGDDLRMRVGLPSSIGHRAQLTFLEGADQVEDYKSCRPKVTNGAQAAVRLVVDQWGKGRFTEGATNPVETDTCRAPTCTTFQGQFFGEGGPLTAPSEGFGQIRQTPSLRRFIQLAQMALEPGDPISFAPYYSIKPMTDPYGQVIAPHAVLTLNTIGDMNVPLNSGIQFARATGALPFLRPDQAITYPEYANYATPQALYDALGGRTPNQELIDAHVIEGITALARHPADPRCEASANAAFPDGTFVMQDGTTQACFPTGCTPETEALEPGKGRVCYGGSYCEVETQRCLPYPNGLGKCEEALWDADDLDEGTSGYYEQSSRVPHRLARYTQPATAETLNDVWAPRLLGVPGSADGAWVPDGRPITALLDAYTVPEGRHTFENGEPCQSWDYGTYLTNLTAHFFRHDGRDLYYLSHPATHRCLGKDLYSCGYLTP